MSNPWSKFFWSDWLADTALGLCSLAAQGLWMRMLCIAAAADPVGHLVNGDEALTMTDIARLCGETVDEASRLIRELESHRVFSRTKAGTIYSRRLIRDHRKLREAAEYGKSGGNPALTKNYDTPGYLYLAGVRRDGAYKVGISVDPRNRLKKIRAQYREDNIRLLDSVPVGSMGGSEAGFHAEYASKKDGEWFFLTPLDIAEITEKWRTLKGSNKEPSSGTVKGPSGKARVQSPESRKKESHGASTDAPPTQGQGDPNPKRGSRLPPNWQPSDQLSEFCGQLGLDPRKTADSFRDYWVAVPGAKGSKLDWDATFRNWCRRDAERTPGDSRAHARTGSRGDASQLRVLDQEEERLVARTKLLLAGKWALRTKDAPMLVGHGAYSRDVALTVAAKEAGIPKLRDTLDKLTAEWLRSLKPSDRQAYMAEHRLASRFPDLAK